MKSNFNNRTLLIVLAVLVGAYALTQWLRQPNTRKAELPVLATIDTARVSQISMLAPGASQPVTLSREGGVWTVAQGNAGYRPDGSQLRQWMSTLAGLGKAKRLATENAENWADYQITDEEATQLTIEEGQGLTTANLWLGRTTFAGAPTTYVRLADGDAVYQIDGNLGNAKNDLSFWRSKLVLANVRADNVQRLSYQYAADSSFALARTITGGWAIDEAPADSSAAASFINGMGRITGTVYTGSEVLADTSLVGVLQVALAGGSQPITITGYRHSIQGQYIMESSLNPGTRVQIPEFQYNKLWPARSKFVVQGF